MYIPDRWVLIKITGTDPHYRIFGYINGGFTTGDSWKLNSGITKVEEEEDFYLFYGYSGSIYKCSKIGYGIKSIFPLGIINQLIENSDGKMKMIDKFDINLLYPLVQICH